MFDKELYKETFSKVKASENILTEVMNMTTNRKRIFQKPFLIAATIAIFFTFTVIAYAANHINFLDLIGATPKAEADIDSLREAGVDFSLYEIYYVAGLPVFVLTYDFTDEIHEEALPIDTIIRNIIIIMDTEYGVDVTSLSDVFFSARYFSQLPNPRLSSNTELHQWNIFLHDAHDAKNDLFYFEVNAISGEITHSGQNTEETPFVG